MSYTIIENFKGGLDSTSSSDVALPGTLTKAQNGYINSGGEFERGKKFVPIHNLPDTKGMLCTDSNVYTFTSKDILQNPAGITIKKLVHPQGLDIAEIITATTFKNKPYVIAKFEDDSVYHFYDGVLITDWHDGVVFEENSIADIIASIANKISQNVAYSVEYDSSTMTVTADKNFTVEVSCQNNGTIPDQNIGYSMLQSFVPAVPSSRGRASFSLDSILDEVQTIKIDENGSEFLLYDRNNLPNYDNSAIAELDSGDRFGRLYLDLSLAINTMQNRYISVASSTGVEILAPNETDTSSFNLKVKLSNDTESSDGFVGFIAAVPSTKKKVLISISGTFEVQDTFNIKLDNVDYGYSPSATIPEQALLIKDNKTYTLDGSLIRFSELSNPLKWKSYEKGSGFMDVSAETESSEKLIAIKKYQSESIVAFSRTQASILQTSEDENANVYLQTLSTGCIAPRSAISVGDTDIYFLSDTGIRSIRSYQNYNLPFVYDVGTPVNKLITDYLDELDEEVISKAHAVIEPKDGRFFLSLGDKIFVHSCFPSKKVSAWSTFEDVKVDQFGVSNGYLYARIGDNICIYGGKSKNEYDNDMPVVVETPFLNMGMPANDKQLKGFSAAFKGTWKIEILADPNNPTVTTYAGEINGNSFADNEPMLAYKDIQNYVAFRFTLVSPDEQNTAKVLQFAVHYDNLGSD
ncbi:MAG: hypothetical protein GY793_08425 [Proteobacteria bacterium]|nr:hypothetical protein [Pseudomonadota bacterium]